MKIAIIYNNKIRSDTTGTYCYKALLRMGYSVVHFLPKSIHLLEKRLFDLFIVIDDGTFYEWRKDLRPSVFWAIDTHINYQALKRKALSFNHVFTAQLHGAEQFNKEGINAIWLPLACDPYVHKKLPLKKEHDVTFIGNLNTPKRRSYILSLKQRYNANVGRAYGLKMAEEYSKSRIVFNEALNNDLNMRVFEALSCGSLLITERIHGAGQEKLFQNYSNLVEYSSPNELYKVIHHFLTNEVQREQIALNGHKLVLKKHTYEHRMRTILKEVL